MSWARRLKRVFAIEIDHWPRMQRQTSAAEAAAVRGRIALGAGHAGRGGIRGPRRPERTGSRADVGSVV